MELTSPVWIPPAMAEPEGLVGVGGDLSPDTLIRAYSEGVFPWYNPGDPILWWSPDPRAVIEFDGLHISRSLARTMRSGKFTVTRNRAFAAVVAACADTRRDETWITSEMQAAYFELHQRGIAHSVETWLRGPEAKELPPGPGWQLAGGIYGVAIGGLFAGESMFHFVTDASKVALVSLMDHLRSRGFGLFDTQLRTEHTTRMGAIDIPRSHYLRRLKAAIALKSIRFA